MTEVQALLDRLRTLRHMAASDGDITTADMLSGAIDGAERTAFLMTVSHHATGETLIDAVVNGVVK